MANYFYFPTYVFNFDKKKLYLCYSTYIFWKHLPYLLAFFVEKIPKFTAALVEIFNFENAGSVISETYQNICLYVSGFMLISFWSNEMAKYINQRSNFEDIWKQRMGGKRFQLWIKQEIFLPICIVQTIIFIVLVLIAGRLNFRKGRYK